LAVDSPALPSLNRTVNGWGSQRQKRFIKGDKKFFPSRFTILRFEIVNVYRYIQLQGQENYDFTIFTNVTTLTALVILLYSVPVQYGNQSKMVFCRTNPLTV